MSYSTTFEELDDYLYVTIEGQESYKCATQLAATLIEKCKVLNYKKVLVEENLDGELSIIDTYRLMVFCAKTLLKHRIQFKLAYYDHKKEQLSRNSFAQDVLKNRTGIIIKIFYQFDEAKEWLLSDS